MSGWLRLSNGTTWPAPDTDDPGLSWMLTYGEPSREQLVAAASKLRAYDHLIATTSRDRALICREIRALASTPGAKS